MFADDAGLDASGVPSDPVVCPYCPWTASSATRAGALILAESHIRNQHGQPVHEQPGESNRQTSR